MSATHHNILEAKHTMTVIAARVRNGETLTTEDREQLRLLRAWCDSLAEGGTLDPADIYCIAEEAA